MSGFIGADPEQLERLAQSLAARSDELRASARGLTVVVADVGWRGPSALAFSAEWRSRSAPSLLAAAEALATLAGQIRAERAEQDQASAVPGSAGHLPAGSLLLQVGVAGATGGDDPLWPREAPPFDGWRPLPWPWVPLPLDQAPAEVTEPATPVDIGPIVGLDPAAVGQDPSASEHLGGSDAGQVAAPEPGTDVGQAVPEQPTDHVQATAQPATPAGDAMTQQGTPSAEATAASAASGQAANAPAGGGPAAEAIAAPGGSPSAADPGTSPAAVASSSAGPAPGSPAAVVNAIHGGRHLGFLPAAAGAAAVGAAAGAGVVVWRSKHRHEGEYLDNPMARRMGLDHLAVPAPAHQHAARIGSDDDVAPAVVSRAEGWAAFRPPAAARQ